MGSSPQYMPAPQQDNSAMLALIASMQLQNEESQKAAQESQDKAVFNTQLQAAQQAVTQGRQQTEQQFGLAEMNRQAQDAAALDQYKKSSTERAESASGGTFDVNAMKKQQMENLGAVNYALPQSAANLAATKTANPAATTAGSANKFANQFNLPSVNDIKLGGY